MKWDGPSLARFVRDAGFYGDAVPVAVAIATATSGGLDHYHHRAGMPGVGDWRGLFGVDVDRYSEYAAADLFSPQVNARAAHQLTATHKGWHWNDAYLAGTWQHWHDDAKIDATRTMHHQESDLPNYVIGTRARIDQFTADMAAMHATLHAHNHGSY